MYSLADIALYAASGRLTAVVEIKNKLGTSAAWAAKTRRNLLAHGGYTSADFFLLVTPDRLYVWKDAGTDPVETSPTYQADAQSTFEPYFKRVGLDPRQIGGNAFELIVFAWLNDLIQSSKNIVDSVSEDSWLATSGFLTAVKNGRIEYEAAA